MVKYELLHKNDASYTYKYHPEGKDDFGLLRLDIGSKECEIVELAEADEFKSYAFHAIDHIEEKTEKGNPPEQGMVAWY